MSEPIGPPVFVVGSMRSGSTMLRLILDSHPNIAIGAETGFMGGLLAAKSIPNWRHGADWYTRINWTEDEVDERLRTFYGEMFARFAGAQGKGRWGEKTPFHTLHMDAMAQVFPDAIFVGIVRHPGAVATSLRKSFHYGFSEALSYWQATNLAMIRSACMLRRRFALIRYEDVVIEGEPVLHELAGFVGEPWSPTMLQHHRVQQAKGAPRAVDGSTISSDPIDASRAERWTDTLAEQDRAALETTAGLAGFFGYEVGAAAARHPLLVEADDRHWLPTGDDLSRRRREWAGRVDFDEEPPSLAIDARPEELAARLAQVEQALARTRSRRSVRVSEAIRHVQHGRSARDLRRAWALLRGSDRA